MEYVRGGIFTVRSKFSQKFDCGYESPVVTFFSQLCLYISHLKWIPLKSQAHSLSHRMMEIIAEKLVSFCVQLICSPPDAQYIEKLHRQAPTFNTLFTYSSTWCSQNSIWKFLHVHVHSCIFLLLPLLAIHTLFLSRTPI